MPISVYMSIYVHALKVKGQFHLSKAFSLIN